MIKTTKIYKNYGCLAAEKRIIYTHGMPQPTAKCSDEIIIKIPEGWETYENDVGETILTAPWGKFYEMNEILCGDEFPCFRTFGNGERIRLEVM